MTRTQRDRRNAHQRARYRKNAKPFIDAAVRWRRNHPDKFRVYQQAWRKRNRKRRAHQYLKNRKHINAQRRARYRANAEKERARSRAWDKAHAEQVAERKRKWYYTNLKRERAAALARYYSRKLF